MKVLVWGSRKWRARSMVFGDLDKLLSTLPEDDVLIVMEGGASGADRYARDWCDEMAGDDHGVIWDPHPAKWQEHHPDWCNGDCAGSRKPRPYCSVAGFRRNQEMADERPDFALGYGDTNGTLDMRDRLRAAGLRFERVWFNPDQRSVSRETSDDERSQEPT